MAKSFSALLQRAKKSDEFWAHTAILEFTEELAECMEKQHINRSELAARVGASPPYITKVLRGTENLTVMTMAKLARGVGKALRLHLAPHGTRTHFLDTPTGDEIHVVDWDEQRTLSASVSAEGGQNDDTDSSWPERRLA
jgi:transcriptional regulator with XRE-family HTH domain